jgi:translation initiation factor IF-3
MAIRPPQPQDTTLINTQIRVPQVRLVGENVELGVYDTAQALEMARKQEADLVMINEKADPPVCRIVDYGKYLYEKKKRDKDLKAKSVKVELKEIRFGPNTDDHDFNFKVNHSLKFLQQGHKVRATLMFRGRSIIHKDRGELLLLQFIEKLEEHGKPEQMPKLEGKKMFVQINPKSTKK